MINLLILLAGLVIMVVSLGVGIVLPLGRATPGRPAPPARRSHGPTSCGASSGPSSAR